MEPINVAIVVDFTNNQIMVQQHATITLADTLKGIQQHLVQQSGRVVRVCTAQQKVARWEGTGRLNKQM